jgi:predicted transposase YdaD
MDCQMGGRGIEQGKEITVRNLLKMGMPIAEIAQATELPVEKVMQMNSE